MTRVLLFVDAFFETSAGKEESFLRTLRFVKRNGAKIVEPVKDAAANSLMVSVVARIIQKLHEHSNNRRFLTK